MVVRRLTARNVRISNLRRRGRRSGGWTDVPERIRKRINLSTRQAAVVVMNDLAERGPRYSGVFINQWKAVSLTGSGFTSEGKKYPYSIKDIPKLDTKSSTMNTVRVFEIFNTSSYAMEAMDLIPGDWQTPPSEPLGGIAYSSKVPGGVLHGWREKDQTLRWDVKPIASGGHVSTAEKNWYINYVKGGGLHSGVKRALKFTYK